MDLQNDLEWYCPECQVEFFKKAAFIRHLTTFNHAKALKEKARDDKWVAIWLTGTFCDVAKMARRYHIDYEYLRKLLIKKGALNVRKQGSGNKTDILPSTSLQQDNNRGQSMDNENGINPAMRSRRVSDAGLSPEGLRPEEPIQNQPGEVINEITN
jgi:hypothetical protein